jgi:uncharacterized protein
MKAVDTSILVYAHRKEAPRHTESVELLTTLAEASAPWAIAWPCISEFYSVVTNVKIWKSRASSPAQALSQIDAWCKSPGVELLSEVDTSLELLADILLNAQVKGPVVHDARIVALCMAHGVRALLTADRDFSRFPQLNCECPW